jgi:multiple sugar transport system permease protein
MNFKSLCFGVVIILITTVMVFPIFWVSLTAFRPGADAYSVTLPSRFTLANFIYIIKTEHYARYTLNSLIISGLSTLFSLTVGGLAGYAFARFRAKGTRGLFNVIFTMRTVPYISFVIPLFFIVRSLRLYDTYTGLLIPHVAIHTCLVSWIMKGFFEQIPRELEEAAIIDGCSRLKALLRIILPVSLPGLTAAGTLVFLWDWNELLFAVILTGTERTRVLPLAIAQKVQELGLQWELMTAAAFIAIIPAILMVFFAQSYIIRGLTFGAVKE